MKRYIDLHLHTNCSDGWLTPEQLMARLRSKDLAAFAVVDHDTIEGYRQVGALQQSGDPELVSGVELSVAIDGADLHMLAYAFDPDHPGFGRALDDFRAHRDVRGRRIIERLREQGIDIGYESVEEAANGAVVGRPHIAQALHRRGVTRTYEEAFSRYIGYHCPAYVPKSELGPKEAIALVHEAGGVAVLAHPYVADMVRFVDMLVPLGLDGIEAYHYMHKQSFTHRMIALAERHDMIITGGSDYHGRTEQDADIGSQRVPFSCLERLNERARRYQ